jgi:hypothetical protein
MELEVENKNQKDLTASEIIDAAASNLKKKNKKLNKKNNKVKREVIKDWISRHLSPCYTK